MKNNKPMDICPFCATYCEYNVKENVETVEVGDIQVTVLQHVVTCAHCGEEIDVPKYSIADQRAAFEAYKEAKGLVNAKQLKDYRREHHLTAVEMARLLHLGDKTITRFETGAIQSESVDLLLKLAMRYGVPGLEDGRGLSSPATKQEK